MTTDPESEMRYAIGEMLVRFELVHLQTMILVGDIAKTEGDRVIPRENPTRLCEFGLRALSDREDLDDEVRFAVRDALSSFKEISDDRATVAHGLGAGGLRVKTGEWVTQVNQLMAAIDMPDFAGFDFKVEQVGIEFVHELLVKCSEVGQKVTHARRLLLPVTLEQEAAIAGFLRGSGNAFAEIIAAVPIWPDGRS